MEIAYTPCNDDLEAVYQYHDASFRDLSESAKIGRQHDAQEFLLAWQKVADCEELSLNYLVGTKSQCIDAVKGFRDDYDEAPSHIENREKKSNQLVTQKDMREEAFNWLKAWQKFFDIHKGQE